MYKFPEDLGVLKTWLAGHGQDVASIVTERQAAFYAQKMAGTRYRFPAKGESCHGFLLNVQNHVIKQSAARTDSRTLRHPGRFRAVWKSRITAICDTLMEMPEYEPRMHKWGPIRLGEQLSGMGATEQEVTREVAAYQQALSEETARRRQAKAAGVVPPPEQSRTGLCTSPAMPHEGLSANDNGVAA